MTQVPMMCAAVFQFTRPVCVLSSGIAIGGGGIVAAIRLNTSVDSLSPWRRPVMRNEAVPPKECHKLGDRLNSGWRCDAEFRREGCLLDARSVPFVKPIASSSICPSDMPSFVFLLGLEFCGVQVRRSRK